MTILVQERLKSPQRESGSQNSQKHKFIVGGTSDVGQAELAVLAQVDDSVTMNNGNQLPLNSIETDAIGFNQGDVLWECTVTYGADPDKNKKQASFKFETSGGTQKITQSIETLGTYAPSGKTATDQHGAIGVNGDQVEGCEITVPVLKWTEKHFLQASLLSPTYIKALAGVTGKTNNAMFRSFDIDEVLFLGAEGGSDGTEIAELDFKFQASPNQTDITIGTITGINKPGWAYLWIEYEPFSDTTSKGLGKRPKGVYVERVYYSGDYGVMAIPTGATLT